MLRIFISLFIFCLIHFTQSKLEQVISIFRHGARYHLNSMFHGDQYRPYWGELTGVGMAQHQNLGQILRKQYIQKQGLISSKYTKGEIEVFSTEINRTMQSLSSQLFGLYPPGTGPNLLLVNKKYYLPPFTNKTDDPQHNFVFPNGHQAISMGFNQQFLKDDCDKQLEYYKKNIELEQADYDQIMVTYKPFIQKVASLFNLTSNVTLSTVAALTGDIEVGLHLGKSLPDNFTQDDLQNIRHLTDWYHQLTEGKDLAKAKNLYKLRKVIDTFNGRIKSPSSPMRLTLLSAHDVDLFPLLNDLNFSSYACIEQLYRKGQTSALNCQKGAPFASSIIFQLHSINNTYKIKIRVNGKYMNLCGVQSTECKYDDWKKLVTSNLGTDQQAINICGPIKSLNPVQIQQQYFESSQVPSWIGQLKKVMQK